MTKAAAELADIFDRKQPRSTDMPRVGIFGNGVPLTAIVAAGCQPVDVKSPPAGRLDCKSPAVAEICEPFVDDFAQVFLHRLFAGDFDDFALIVLPHSDAAAHMAYMYATELLRQKRAAIRPNLHLFNLAHGKTDGTEAFNKRQMEKLIDALIASGGHAPQNDDWTTATRNEHRRFEALQKLSDLQSGRAPIVSGTSCFIWRNAGRYLDAGDHAALLESACNDALQEPSTRQGLRVGLVGTALEDASVLDAIEQHGTMVCDLQPFGQLWPAAPADPAVSGAQSSYNLANDLLSPLQPRTDIARDEMVRRIMAAECDLVVAQYDRNDDTFGWMLPGLKRDIEARHIGFIDAGHRDLRASDNWRFGLAEKLQIAGEGNDG